MLHSENKIWTQTSNFIFTRGADCLHEVTGVPELMMLLRLSQVRELTEEADRGCALQVLYDKSDREFRWCGDETVYVVLFPHLHVDDLKAVLGSDLPEYAPEGLFDLRCEDPAAVLDTPDDVVTDAVYRCPVISITYIFHVYSIPRNRHKYNKNNALVTHI